MKILHPAVIIRVLLGALFVISGFTKLVEPYQNFLSVINSYQVVSPSTASLVAQIFPWFELVFGTFLILGLWLRQSLFMLITMSSIFIGVILAALIRKLPINDCGCFGELIHLPLHVTLVFDIGMWILLLCLLIFNSYSKIASLDGRFNY